MNDIQSCLSIFAVASGANNDRSAAMAERAIQQYLAAIPADGRRSALENLATSFRDMLLDSNAAKAIGAMLLNASERLEPQAEPTLCAYAKPKR